MYCMYIHRNNESTRLFIPTSSRLEKTATIGRSTEMMGSRALHMYNTSNHQSFDAIGLIRHGCEPPSSRHETHQAFSNERNPLRSSGCMFEIKGVGVPVTGVWPSR